MSKNTTDLATLSGKLNELWKRNQDTATAMKKLEFPENVWRIIGLTKNNRRALALTSWRLHNHTKHPRRQNYQRTLYERMLANQAWTYNAPQILADLADFAADSQYNIDQLLTNRTLRFTDQCFDFADCQALAAIIRFNKMLQELDLEANQLGDICAKDLANALMVNNTLLQLDLHETQIGEVGAKHFANTLKVNNTLKELSLDNNQIGCIGAQHLLDALAVNNTLQRLLLRVNNISVVNQNALISKAFANKTITELFF